MADPKSDQRRENEKTAAGVGAGTAAGAGVMPVRPPNNRTKNPYKHLPEGIHHVPVEDARSVARKTGTRFQNRAYTAKLAEHVRDNPDSEIARKPSRVAVYDDGHVSQVDGAHRIYARHMLGHKTVPVEVVHVKGNRPPRYGAKVAYNEIASKHQRGRLKRDYNMSSREIAHAGRKLNPKVQRMNEKISGVGSVRVQGGKLKSTHVTAPLKGMGTKMLRAKQGGWLAAGASAGYAATHPEKIKAAAHSVKAKVEDKVNKRGRNMSDAEIRRRQKLQSKIGRTTSTMGLTGLGLTGAALVTRKSPRAMGKLKKVPGFKNTDDQKLKNTAINLGIVSGGIGGVGGFNQASIYSAESRRRRAAAVTTKPKKEVSKSMDMGYYGDEGIAKAWQPVSSDFNPERDRRDRSKAYQYGSVGAGAAGAGVAVHQGRKYHSSRKKLNAITTGGTEHAPVKQHQLASGKNKGSFVARANPKDAVKATPTSEIKTAVKATRVHGGRAAAALGVTAAAVGVHELARKGRKGSWQSYEKRDTEGVSAFGVAHTEWTAQ